MTWVRGFCFLALVVTVSLWSSVTRAQPPSPVQSSHFTLGVVRGDGILLPLASRESEGWTELRSLVSDGDHGVFRLLDAQGLAREGWTYVPWDTGVPRPLTIRDMVTTDAHCERQEGFATNAPTPGPNVAAPHLVSGIAVHGNVSTVPIENVVRQPDDASRRVARFIVQLTHAVESERTSIPPRSPERTIPSSERGRVPVQITTLARDRVGDVGFYYFEAHKRYGAVESYANGWIASSPFSISALRRVIAWESTDRVRQVFVVEPGEVVTALTGDVWTMVAGLAKYNNDPEPVYLLVSEGEGLVRTMVRGSVATIDIAAFKQLDIPGAGYSGCVRNNTCIGEIFSYPKNTWWVQIRNSKGQIGWTDQTRDLDCKNAISTCRDDLEPRRKP
jgi:hypothetical protein